MNNFRKRISLCAFKIYDLKKRVLQKPVLPSFYPYRGLETHTNSLFESKERSYNFNENFCTYLAGLIEGDGSIIVPKEENSKKNKKNYPSVQIFFHLKDLPLALTVQKELNCGSLNRKKGVNAYIYTINSIEGLTLLSFCIYRYMRTPKIYDLWKLIDWLNNQKKKNNNFHITIREKTENKGTPVCAKSGPLLVKIPFFKKKERRHTHEPFTTKVGVDESPLLENAWLSGFIEADGHFSVRATLSLYKIECRMEIVQSTRDHNNISKKDFLEKIAYIIHSTVKTIRQTKPNKEYRVRSTNIKGNLVCKQYLQKYPLFGTKFLDFQDWCIVLQFFEKNLHKNKSFYNQIVQIKQQMNRNRTNYRWDHLKNFYHLEK